MPKASKNAPERALLLAIIDEAYNKRAWHGPSLRGCIRRVTPAIAAWRPRPGRRNIAEILVHCAYWKYAVRRRIRGDKRGSFPLKGSNWFELPRRLTKREWQAYVRLLDEQHHQLRDTLASAAWSRLRNDGNGIAPTAAHVHGIAMHDLYHAGQIQTIKALHKQASAG
ncbi:MAG: DinB family protein [Phycisphaerae bacterium]